MNSDGSTYNSDSDVSDSLSDLCTEMTLERPFQEKMPRRTRRTSVTSVSTNPEEEAYVMVMQNKNGLFRDFKAILASRELCDVTFLVGEERRPVIGVRAIISARSRALDEMILDYERKQPLSKSSKISHLKRKLTKLTCSSHRSSYRGHGKLTIPVENFDYESFQRLILYIHCGTLTVDARSVIGILNAAVIFEFPEVRQACWEFALGCSIRDDNLQDLMDSSKQYSQNQITVDLFKTLKMCTTQYPELSRHSSTLDKMIADISKAT